LEKLPGIISVGILAIIVILIGCFYKKVLQQHRYFLAYCLVLFCYEFVLLITAFMKIDNHWVANVNTFIYGIISVVVLSEVYKKYHKNTQSLKMILLALLVVFATGWVVENFAMDRTIFIYNSRLAGILSIFTGLIGIYLLNVLIFANSGSLFRDPDVLVVVAILLRSITFGFSLWFLNFDYGFDHHFLSNLLTGINVGLCLADMFLLLAVQRISFSGKELVKVVDRSKA
jgi:hypothetical protein